MLTLVPCHTAKDIKRVFEGLEGFFAEDMFFQTERESLDFNELSSGSETGWISYFQAIVYFHVERIITQWANQVPVLILFDVYPRLKIHAAPHFHETIEPFLDE